MRNNQFQIIEKCKKGDLASKEWIYRKYAPLLLGICMRYIKDRMEAEDVLHEGFITIYEKIHQFEHKGSFEGWIKRIIVNKALNYLKSNNNSTDIEDIVEPSESENEKAEPTNVKDIISEADFSKEEMLEIINTLPIGFKTVFNLYVFEKLQHKEIAEKLNISIGTSKSQLLRARKLVQKKLYNKVLEKKNNKKKEIITYGALLIMNNEYNYIDELARNKLDGMSINPVSSFSDAGFSGMSTSGSATSTSTVANIKSQLLAFAGNKIAWVTTAVIGTTAALVSINQKNTEPAKLEPIVIISDSIYIEEPKDEILDFIKTEQIINKNNTTKTKTIIARKKVPIKKRIKISKSIQIKDTVKIIDTIRRNN